ncbi:Plasmid stabilization system protein ParE [Halpernia humi]|uniref:Plasmid stabilization system protein ParE n=1 Tax=Halpernia humi TaxID=493375 RepID=A0A1H5WUM0_9FLAO|nr:type II toxin-antitoxin system RelE/ParE family toxin [Halpernia humi]SEG03154.1 Plasmid stabilization system protein ParE [Halpernia humi]
MFQVKWTDEAEEKYFETLEFWIENNKSTTYSKKIVNEVIYTESLLKDNPLIGQIVEGTKDEVRRVLVLYNYSIFYRINENIIEIISFWANKMNPEDLKL